MTKCIVLGGQTEKEKKPIVFKKYLGGSLNVEDAVGTHPENFPFIELVCKEYTDEYDLMLAYDVESSRGGGTLFIGHWNDGIV